MPEPVAFRFDYKSPTALDAAETTTAHLVTRVSEETKAALRALMAKGIAEGIAPRKLVRLIQDSIGLNAPQSLALLNYRLRLETEDTLSSANVDKAVARYSARLLAARKLMIARTETMRALNIGKLEAARQAQREGWLGPEAKKQWSASPDELVPPVCDECSKLDGEAVLLIGRFSSGDSCPPAHPHCRCSMKILPGEALPLVDPVLELNPDLLPEPQDGQEEAPAAPGDPSAPPRDSLYDATDWRELWALGDFVDFAYRLIADGEDLARLLELAQWRLSSDSYASLVQAVDARLARGA